MAIPIKDGDVIGIADGAIEAVGSRRARPWLMELLDCRWRPMTPIRSPTPAGEDFADDAFEALVARIGEEFDELEIDAHRGDQPLYSS